MTPDEVGRAAQRMARRPVATPTVDGPLALGGVDGRSDHPAPRVRTSVALVGDDTWSDIAADVLDSAAVSVVGLMPRPLLEALRSIVEAEKDRTGPYLSYATPLPEIALSQSATDEAVRYRNRWQAGLFGVANLNRVFAMRRADTQPRAAAVRGFSRWFSDCILQLTDSQQRVRVLLVTCLPQAVPPSSGYPAAIVTELPADAVPEVRRELDELTGSANPVMLREISCLQEADLLPQCGDDLFPRIRIRSLVEYGDSVARKGRLQPISVVVARFRSFEGAGVLLKLRTPYTDADDFGKLSLLSSRVQETDLAGAVRWSLSPSDMDPAIVLDTLWQAAGAPEVFAIPLEAFVVAAQREVSLSLGLEVDADRLQYRGFHLVARENDDLHLGFAVFTIDLDVQGGELNLAISRNPDGLRKILKDDLYAEPEKLNRLLRKRQEWIQDHCLEVP